MEAEHAEGADQLSAALQRRDWEAVLYAGDGPGAVPARKALALVRLADPHLPFLAVSPWVRAGDLAAVIRGLDADVPSCPIPRSCPPRSRARSTPRELRRRVGGAHRLLLAQQAITDAIAAGLAPDALAARVLATLGDTLGWSCGVVWRPARRRHAALRRHLARADRPRGGRPRRALGETSFAPGQGLPGRVYAFRRPSWVRDVGRDGGDPRAAQARRAGLMTSLAFPIAHGDRCAGVIEFFSRGIARPNAEVSAMFATVGHQLAQVLERAHDREETEHRPPTPPAGCSTPPARSSPCSTAPAGSASPVAHLRRARAPGGRPARPGLARGRRPARRPPGRGRRPRRRRRRQRPGRDRAPARRPGRRHRPLARRPRRGRRRPPRPPHRHIKGPGPSDQPPHTGLTLRAWRIG